MLLIGNKMDKRGFKNHGDKKSNSAQYLFHMKNPAGYFVLFVLHL